MTDTPKPSSANSYLPAEHRRRSVLVAVMNNQADMRRVASEGWYRIPQRRAPARIGADFIAFYQTGAFRGEPEAQTVTFYAPTRRYRLLTRADMLPDEADHPRAQDYYYRIDLGPLQRLERPIQSKTLRRVTFIQTTLEQLLCADDVRELFLPEDPFQKLWQALRDNKLRPLKNRLVDERPVDITLRARGGYLGIICSESPPPKMQETHLRDERWSLLWFSAARIEDDLPSCLREIGASLISLGGSDLNRPQGP